jgi:hypothetical protein
MSQPTNECQDPLAPIHCPPGPGGQFETLEQTKSRRKSGRSLLTVRYGDAKAEHMNGRPCRPRSDSVSRRYPRGCGGPRGGNTHRTGDRSNAPHQLVHTWKDFFIHIATICVCLSQNGTLSQRVVNRRAETSRLRRAPSGQELPITSRCSIRGSQSNHTSLVDHQETLDSQQSLLCCEAVIRRSS